MQAKQKQWVGIAAAAGVMLVLSGGAWLHHRAAATRKHQISQLESELASQHTITDTLATLRAQSAEQVEALTDLQHAVPEHRDVGGLLERLGGHLADKNVRNREMTTGAITSGTRFSSMPLTLKFRSSFDATYDLLCDLEGESELMRAELIDIRRHFDRPDEPLAVTIQLSTFSQAAQ